MNSTDKSIMITVCVIVLCITALLMMLVLRLNSPSADANNTARQRAKLDACKSISDPGMRIICIRGTGY